MSEQINRPLHGNHAYHRGLSVVKVHGINKTWQAGETLVPVLEFDHMQLFAKRRVRTISVTYDLASINSQIGLREAVSFFLNELRELRERETAVSPPNNLPFVSTVRVSWKATVL